MHIESRAVSDTVNGMIVIMLMTLMIVLVMVSLLPEALRPVDSVGQHSSQTFHNPTDYHQRKNHEEYSRPFEVRNLQAPLPCIALLHRLYEGSQRCYETTSGTILVPVRYTRVFRLALMALTVPHTL